MAPQKLAAVQRWLRRFDALPTLLSQESKAHVSLQIDCVIFGTYIKSPNRKAECTNTPDRRDSRIFIYDDWFLRLEAHPKNKRDQLIVILATRQGFRSSEITTNRVSHYHFDVGILEVLDSKKHRYYPLVLRPVTALAAVSYFEERGLKDDDLTVTPYPQHRGRKRKPGSDNLGEGLRIQQIEVLFAKYSLLAGLPKKLNPQEARAYFCYHTYKKCGIFDTQLEMRHDFVETTMHYLKRITNWKDHQAAVLAGEQSPFNTHCQHEKDCPLASVDPACYCRSFLPIVSTISQVNKDG